MCRKILQALKITLNLDKLGERTLWVDCDVIEADGGTRTASITGAYIALVDALQSIKKDLPNPITDILTDSVAAAFGQIVFAVGNRLPTKELAHTVVVAGDGEW